MANFHLILFSLIIFGIICSLVLNYVLLRFSKTLGIRSRKGNEIRWDPNSKPSLGGIAFYLVFLFAFVAFAFISPSFKEQKIEAFGLLLSCSVAFLMGLADDAFNTQPVLKLVSQIVCALVILYTNQGIVLFENVLINYLVTVIWVIAIMNSVNLIDNMDGIAGSIALLVMIFCVTTGTSLMKADSILVICAACISGGIIGFLFYNFHPSKLYMGDSGSQFLGFFVAIIGIKFGWNNHNFGELNPILFNSLVISLLFMLPIIDTTTVFINRIKSGRSPFVGGKDHTTHHLFFNGVTEKRINILYLFLNGLSIILAYRLVFNPNMSLMILAGVYNLFVFISLYYVSIRKRNND